MINVWDIKTIFMAFWSAFSHKKEWGQILERIHYTLQSLYYTTRYNTVLVITRPGLGSQMVIFLQFFYKIIPL